MVNQRRKTEFNYSMGLLPMAFLPVSADFAFRGQTASSGGLRPREQRRRAYYHQSFNIEHNRFQEHLELNLHPPPIPRPFFHLREDPFERRPDFRQQAVLVFVLPLHIRLVAR